MIKLICSLFSALFVFLLFSRAIFASHIASPTGFVNDFAGVLIPEQKTTIEDKLASYEKETSNEISVAIVKNLNGGDIDDFTVRTFEEWKIGKKGKDNGILFLASLDERKIRIEVGYGLEGNLTDSQAGEIIRNVIAPEFKNGNYYVGIFNGIDAIERNLGGQIYPDKEVITEKNFVKNLLGKMHLAIVLFVILIYLIYIFAYLARSKSIWGGGIVGTILGALIGIILGSLIVTVILAVVLAALGVILDWLLSRNYKNLVSQGRETSWWASRGGFWGGSGGGDGGFGGFGGGGSGGGGASGGW